MFYLLAFLAGAVVAIALWRYILVVVYWTGMAIAVVLAWRIIERLNTSTNTYAMPIFVGAMSAVVVCVLFSGYIRHTLIYFYLQDAIAKQKQAADKGKLW